VSTAADSEDAAGDESDSVSNESDEDTDTTTARRGVDPDLDPETVSIEYAPGNADPRRIRFVNRDDGPGWWKLEEEWTGHRWRPVGRAPVTDVDITTY